MSTIEEIADNDYNLNIPRYVDTFEEEEEPININFVQNQIKYIDTEILDMKKELNVYLKELGIDEF